jgi:hypothetical protein
LWSLRHVLLITAITAQQPGQQFRLLRADHQLESAHHPIQVVRAQRVLIRDPPRGVHLSFVRFITGLFSRRVSPPSDLTRRASLLSITRAYSRDTSTSMSTVRTRPARADTREARTWTMDAHPWAKPQLSHSERLRAPRRVRPSPGLRVGHLPGRSGDPGAIWRLRPASRHGANPRLALRVPTGTQSTRTRETLPVNGR